MLRFTARKKRSQAGSQLAEFGAALLLLTTVLLIPLLDLVIVPVRWMMAQEIINSYSRKFAYCESLSQSVQMLNMEPSVTNALEKIGGISVNSTDLKIRATTATPGGDSLELYLPAQVPDEWLPNASKGPCVYSLELAANVTIAPAVLFRNFAGNVPGLTSPFPLTLSASHQWENLGRDPSSGEYFLNK